MERMPDSAVAAYQCDATRHLIQINATRRGETILRLCIFTRHTGSQNRIAGL